MAEATLSYGAPETIDHTAAADVSIGQVVPLVTVVANNTGLGLCCGIAQNAISNGVLGALAVGGVWEVTAAGNYANYTKVYWDDTNNKVTSTSTNNSAFGYIVDRGGASVNTQNATVKAMLMPFNW